MSMRWQGVRSSHVIEIGRDDATKDVGVRFHDGAVYIYHDVPDDVWERLLESGSKGRFVNITLRRRYSYDKQ